MRGGLVSGNGETLLAQCSRTLLCSGDVDLAELISRTIHTATRTSRSPATSSRDPDSLASPPATTYAACLLGCALTYRSHGRRQPQDRLRHRWPVPLYIWCHHIDHRRHGHRRRLPVQADVEASPDEATPKTVRMAGAGFRQSSTKVFYHSCQQERRWHGSDL